MRLSVLDQSPVVEGGEPARALHNSIELAVLADDAGYSRYWFAEHHGSRPFAGPAPEIMITRAASATSRITIGSGGVLLTHYSPLKVAETFHVLEALFPGRVDLGIGRAPGAGGLESHLLRPDSGADAPDDFPRRLAQLRGFLKQAEFGAQTPYRDLWITPPVPRTPPVWLLGTSPNSALLAGTVGLPYVFGHFGTPAQTRYAVERYRANFRPSATLAAPRVVVGVGVYCADTTEQAHHVFASQLLFRHRMSRNLIEPIPSPEDALAELRHIPEDPDTTPDPTRSAYEWPRYFVGDPDRVAGQLTDMATRLAVDELIVLTTIHDHTARLRSYELLAKAFALTGN